MSFAMSYEEMQQLLQKSLKPGRYEHSLGVAETAVFLARRFGVDEQKARVAGLLHDCAREFRNEDLISEAEKRLIVVEPLERRMPLLLHAYVGSRLVAEKYGVNDNDIEQAIWRHTVGGPQMTELDKIIWFADMIEPHRDYPEVEMLRGLARTAGLDEMLLVGLTESIAFVLRKGGLVHPATVNARNEILLQK
ncbi:putative metal-dependent phosphohydrolase [Selenomonas ruminantium subsp. lactilytica TAM6421]|uniref:bis(5'-nucleosyl)-tetraphosphatase (symmetrical) n=1 Tax=Selenomonas ruminantium subsp. lactilytica (strain NBRC 103574 / TAM6421) TaxID=927704 RepID=I0GTE0_SELRL|nr:bis(5'-nucleosyl)-tetraphosphatase (symmetrical) YqeK [Selenomonas ruminantium]BAL84027.1 putative metal-dependent phosphohydrolase [Selenomonas ruminantium subsp. lactilytica TAM6421]